MINELRMFSDSFDRSEILNKTMVQGSVSELDMKNRIKTYQKIYENFLDLKQRYKQYSAYTDTDLLSNQYFNATIAGLARSFAGFLTIERAMDQAKALLWFINLLDVNSSTTVLPNVGAENIGNYSNSLATGQVTIGSSSITIPFSAMVIPGSFKATVKINGVAGINLIDDRLGHVLAPAGILTTGTINYTTGLVTLVFVSSPIGGDNYTATAVQNQTANTDGTINRFKTEFQSILVETFPTMLIGEQNLTSIAAMEKALSVDINQIITGKLTELYTKMINKQIVAQIVNNDPGGEVDINLDPSNFKDYRSVVEKFSSELADVDEALGIRSVKGTRATAYVVGTSVLSFFRKTRMLGNFKDVETSYINDLVGYYEGIPVLQHTDIDQYTGYAIHKTIDGNLAPVMRGIFLPLTNTPAVGNYNNPTQLAQGVFYQEQNQSITPDLQQKFVLTNVSL